MQNQQKHKTKKYLNLLKNAENEAFIGLVIQNLQAEIGCGGDKVGRPDKILKVVHFMIHSVLKCQDQSIKHREFPRLKITEALVPLIAQKMDSDNSFEAMVSMICQGINSDDAK